MPPLARGETLRAWGSRYAGLVLERAQGNHIIIGDGRNV
jgi:hypothetical protein